MGNDNKKSWGWGFLKFMMMKRFGIFLVEWVGGEVLYLLLLLLRGMAMGMERISRRGKG